MSAFLSTVSPPRFLLLLLHLRPCFHNLRFFSLFFFFPPLPPVSCTCHEEEVEGEREKERQSSQPEPASQPANHQLLSTLQSTIALFIMPSSLLTGSFLLSRLARAQNRPRGLLSRAPLYPPFFLSVFAIPNSCFVSLVLHRRNIFSPELL